MSILGLPNDYFLDEAAAEDILLKVIQFHKLPTANSQPQC